MIERALILFVAIAVVAVVILMVRLWARRCASKARLEFIGDALPIPLSSAPVALLSFGNAFCETCRRSQKPVVESISAQYAGKVCVLDIDTFAHADLARQMRILTVPSTVIVTSGTIQHVNYGLASFEKLDIQVRSVLESSA